MTGIRYGRSQIGDLAPKVHQVMLKDLALLNRPFGSRFIFMFIGSQEMEEIIGLKKGITNRIDDGIFEGMGGDARQVTIAAASSPGATITLLAVSIALRGGMAEEGGMTAGTFDKTAENISAG